MQKKRLWRQGDVLIQDCDCLPENCRRKKGNVLVRGEASGHTHRVAVPNAAMIFQDRDQDETATLLGTLYLQVVAETADITHPEHHPITLERGLYKVWRQREFARRPSAFLPIAD